VFTGIVQGLCPVVQCEDKLGLRQLTLALGELADGVELGASVAVNGTCLTVTEVKASGQVCFDVIQETLTLTNIGVLAQGSLANVERSMRVGDEIGGHQLSGHVIGTVVLARVEQSANNRVLWFQSQPEWMRYLFYKGFVALDGASLTISAVDRQQHQFAVSLIPETIARTTLGQATPGVSVNLEVDYQAQAVIETLERLLEDPDWRMRLRNALS
jgi:riboflavin synthase